MPKKLTTPIEYLFSWKTCNKIELTEIQEKKCLDFFSKMLKYGIKSLPQRYRIHLLDFVKFNVEGDWYERSKSIKNLPNTVTLEKCILMYGENEGKKRWETYKQKQSITNTFEYKNKKYGMTYKEFEKYNFSRATTESNLIKKYGKKEGKNKFLIYCQKQKDAGCTLKYFIEKYGENEGQKIYKNVCNKKALTLDNFIRKYGEEKGKEKFEIMISRVSSGYSKISQIIFWKIWQKIKKKYTKIYFAELNNEYGVYDEIHKTYKKFDFVILDLKLVIEFDGDHYHGNPRIYSPKDFLKGWGMTKTLAEDKWGIDFYKDNLIRNKGFDTIHIWGSDWADNPTFVLKNILQKIKNRERTIK
jgi:very-short-patch-repair endonuclease